MKKRLLAILLTIAMLLTIVPMAALADDDTSAATTSGKCGTDLTYALSEDGKTLTISGDGAMTNYTTANPAPWSASAATITKVVINTTTITSIGNNAFSGCTSLTEVDYAGKKADWDGITGSTSVTATMVYLTHTWNDGEVTTAATCEADGVKTITCTDCGETKTELIEKLNHLVEKWTNNQDGNHTGTCVREGCGKNITDAHTWDAGKVTTSYSDTADEITTKTCTACGATESTVTKHHYEDVVTDPTCTAEGYTTHTCSVCGGVVVDTKVPAKGHDCVYHDNGDGTHTGICKTCSAKVEGAHTAPEDDTIDTPATETADGKNTYVCTVCELTVTETVHNWGEGVVTTAPTITTAGVMTYTCTNCGATKTEEIAPLDGANGTCGTGMTWKLDTDGKLTISGIGTMTALIPAETWAACKSSVKTIVIDSGATNIAESAFADCTALTSATIPTGVTAIGSSAFKGCTALTAVTIPSSVTTINASAFEGCTGLTGELKLALSASSAGIGSSAFKGCTGLTSVTITGNLTEIAANTFEGCTGLTKATIPATVISIGNSAFAGDTALTGVFTPSSTSTAVPTAVASIGTSAFEGCTALAGTLTLGSSTAAINVGQTAFKDCKALTGAAITAKTASIGNGAFYDCTGLTSAAVTAGTTAESTLGVSVFYGCTVLTSAAITGKFTSIPEYTFYGCTRLESAALPDTVTSIGEKAFYYCIALKTITIPEAVTALGKNVFEGCSALTTVIFECNPPTYSGYTADAPFYNITANAYYPSDNAKWAKTTDTERAKYGAKLVWAAYGTCGEDLKWNLDDEGTLTIFGTGAMTDYTEKDAAPWDDDKDSIKKVVIEDGATAIGSYAFCGCTAITELTISESVESIGESAFNGCTGLTVLTIPEGVTSIGKNAFNGATGITTVSIPKSLTAIGTAAFKGDTALTKVTAADLTAWCGIVFKDGDANPLYYAKNLYIDTELVKELDVPTGVEAVNAFAFAGCTSITSVNIPSTVTTIGQYAFFNATGLTSVTIAKSVTEINVSAFELCSSLKDVNYTGTEAEWNKIVIESNNTPLTGATMHYNYKASKFTDVQDTSQYYYEPVLWAVENGITTGKTDTTFAPDETCTRAQVITFLYRAAGEPAVKSSKNPFSDVKTTDYYYKAVLWGYENEIVKGMSETTFGPDETVSRAQFVTFLYRFADSPAVTTKTNPFTDLPTDEYYTDAVLWAVENGVTTGMTATTFAPNAGCTRGQVVTFLYRYYVEEPEEADD